GFDTLGLAIDLFLEVTAENSPHDELIYSDTHHGTRGRDRGRHPRTDPRAEGNLVHAGSKAAFTHLGRASPPDRLTERSPIPWARGLGSSSAALVAGAALADAWAGTQLGRDGVFRLTAALEGHPDNVGPAVYGGFTVAAADEEG